MPPERRARRATRSGHIVAGGGESLVTDLPDDVLSAIFSRLSGAADAARCAATCRRWGLVVAARAPAISRALPPPGRFLPYMAVGFLHRQDKRARGRAQLRFVPTAAFAASRHHRRQLSLLPSTDDEAAAAARPIASRNGRVVLELRRSGRGQLTTLSVWNPMTGDTSVLPPVSVPGHDYACALLTGDDLPASDDDDANASSSGFFFRLLLVYNRRSFTALRSYDSGSGSWGPEAAKPGAKIGDRALGRLGPAVVLRGVAYWPTRDAALGVRLHDMDVRSLPYLLTHDDADERVLGVSPDGASLRFLAVCFSGRTTLDIAFLATQLLVPGQQARHGFDGFWDPVLDREVAVPGVGRVDTRTTSFKLRWFGEKSGTLLFTVGDDASSSSSSAVYALSVATGALEKLAEGHGYHECTHMCGYEMDRAALLQLASVPPPPR